MGRSLPEGVLESLPLPAAAVVGAAVALPVGGRVAEPVGRAARAEGDELVAVDGAQRAQVAGVVTPELGLDALLDPAAVTDVGGASDGQLGQYGVNRGCSCCCSLPGILWLNLFGSAQGSSDI